MRRERNGLREIAATAKTVANAAFDDHTSTVCRTLCESIYDKFPREVRDIIYGHLYKSVVTRINKAYFEIHAVPTQCAAPAHLWRPEMLGVGMHHELCEHFFRSASFNALANFDLLAEFRVTDQWNVGYVPADFATNVEVKIRCRDYDIHKEETRKKGASGKIKIEEREVNCACCNGPCRNDVWGAGSGGWNTGDGGWGPSENKVAKSRAELVIGLEALFGFASGSSITINVSPDFSLWGHTWNEQWEFQARAHNDMMPLLDPVLARLRASGNQTSVIVSAPSWADFASDFIITGDVSAESYKETFEMVSSAEKLCLLYVGSQVQYQAKAIKIQREAEAEAAAAESDNEEDYEEAEA